jgi:hypothetical protein
VKHRDEANTKKEREYIEKLEQVKLAEEYVVIHDFEVHYGVSNLFDYI